jgi:hypothetical protein
MKQLLRDLTNQIRGFSSPQSLFPHTGQRMLPDVEHLHGASYDSEFTHIAVNPNTQKGIVAWLERVRDDENNK